MIFLKIFFEKFDMSAPRCENRASAWNGMIKAS